MEDALPQAERARFEQHISTCTGCETYLMQMRETMRLVGMLTEESITADAREALLTAFRTWKQGGAV